MKVPSCYSDWVNCFEQFKEGTNDQKLLEAMQSGSIEWSSGVAERLTQRLYDVISYRINSNNDVLQRELDRCNGDETAIVKALLSARRRLAILQQLADLQAFPENVREAMSKSIEDYAASTQESLEKSALSDPTGRLRILIKNNALTQLHQVENIFHNQNASIQPDENLSPNGFKSKRRRVILP